MNDTAKKLGRVVYPGGTGVPNEGVLVLGSDGTNTQYLKVNSDGELIVNLEAADIQIGTVEIKDGTTDTRVKVKTDGVDNAVVVTQNSQPLPTGAATEATLGTVNTNLGTIETDIEATNTALGTVNTNLGTIEADIEAINTALGTVNTNLGIIETDIEATNTKLSDGTQKTQIVDGAGAVIGSTANAIDVNIKGGTTLAVTTDVETGLAKEVTLQKVADDTNIPRANFISPIDFTAVYTSAITITLSVLPITITDSSQVQYIKVIPSTGDAKIYVNGRNGVTIKHAANVLDIAGVTTPFAAGDVYEVGINAQDKGYDSSTNSIVTSELNTVYNRYTDVETLVTAQALTASYADYGAEVDMRGYTKAGIWVITDANDSQDVDLKVLGKHTLAGTDEFEIDGLSVKRVWSGIGTDSKIYYEFDTGGIPYLQIQAIAGTVGATAGTLTISSTKSY